MSASWAIARPSYAWEKRQRNTQKNHRSNCTMPSPFREAKNSEKSAVCGKKWFGNTRYLHLDTARKDVYNTPCAAENRQERILYGGVAQLARAFGSYPECHLFESDRRYQKKPDFRAFLCFGSRTITYDNAVFLARFLPISCPIRGRFYRRTLAVNP